MCWRAGDCRRSTCRSLGRTTIADHPALLLQAAGFPDGGIHGGHLVVVWNQDGAGYVLSMHFTKPEGLTASERRDTMLTAAAAMNVNPLGAS
jgi:hypothetical protein